MVMVPVATVLVWSAASTTVRSYAYLPALIAVWTAVNATVTTLLDAPPMDPEMMS